jgi:hypothetical protein
MEDVIVDGLRESFCHSCPVLVLLIGRSASAAEYVREEGRDSRGVQSVKMELDDRLTRLKHYRSC